MDKKCTYVWSADKWRNWMVCKHIYIYCDVSLLPNPLKNAQQHQHTHRCKKKTVFFIDFITHCLCRNPSLELVIKAGGCKVAGQEEAWESCHMFPGVQESVREWAFTLPRELPPWELESRWTPECSESDCRGQNKMDWRNFYIIKKLLKLRCLKWARITHLDIWNISYGQKKGW
jgi:hypothetical protein